MKKYLIILLLPLLVLNTLTAVAQVQHEGVPWTLQNGFSINSAFTVEFPAAPERWEEQVSESLSGDMKPFVFAWPVDTSINIPEAKNRIFSNDQTEVYQVILKNPSAYSINLIFSKYRLPAGASLFLYNPDYSTVRGAYNHMNNKPYEQLATTPVPGNQIIIELVVEKKIIAYPPELVVGKISFDMKNIFGDKSGHFGRSGDCNVDINCPSGADWQVLKRSVCKFIRGGSFLCSGALINNTANDGKAFLLTANHCIASGLHARLSVFYFNYESPECLGGNGSIDQSISGSNLRATTNKLDFALVELTVKPPESYKPYYAGWDRSPVPFWDTVTCIHHPSGDVKKISFANRRVATGNWGSTFDENVHWNISQWDIGTTEGGSSGSPLFNKDQRIIGDLTGGDASCSYNYNDFFQKLSVSWDRYPGEEEQLKAWLDPDGKDVLIWNGYDPFSQGKPLANFSRRPEQPRAGKYIRFIDKTSGAPDQWNWIFQGGTPSSSQERNPLVYYETPGIKSIVLAVSNSLGRDTITQSLIVENWMDFNANRRELVKGSIASFEFDATGEYFENEWVLSEGVISWQSFDEKIDYRYLQPGLHDVMLTVDYSDYSQKLFHQNYIKVLPNELIYSGHLMSVYNPRESLGVYTLGENGDIPGINSLGYDGYANAFTNSSDTTILVSGVRVDIFKLDNQSESVYLRAGVWDSNWNNLRMDSIKLAPKSIPFRATVWFDQPVGLDSLLYAGILLPDNGVELSTGMTLSRNESDKNDAWGRIQDKWRPLNQAIGLNSAVAVQLETSYAFDNYSDQIKIETIAPDHLRINVSGLVFEKFTLDMFDATGRKVINTSTHDGDYINLRFLNAASGVYILHLRLDTATFDKKVIILK
jgi:PKD repeat protein